MNKKLILGIILPVVIIITLAIVGSLNIGFSAERSLYQTISLKDLSKEGNVYNSLKIGNLVLNNTYFLGKRYEAAALTACLVDSENGRTPIRAGNVFYSEGDSQVTDGSYYDYYNDGTKSIEVGANSKKTVGIFMSPDYQFNWKNYSQLLEDYAGYDSILVIEGPSTYSNRYSDCSDINLENNANITKISLSI
jgi:hypothetical protein